MEIYSIKHCSVWMFCWWYEWQDTECLICFYYCNLSCILRYQGVLSLKCKVLDTALAIWRCFSGLILCVLKKKSCFETKPSEAVCMLIEFFLLFTLPTYFKRWIFFFSVLVLGNCINPLDSYQKEKKESRAVTFKSVARGMAVFCYLSEYRCVLLFHYCLSDA